MEVLEKYLSLFIGELGVSYYRVPNAYYYLKVESVEKLYDYYNSQENHFIVLSEDTTPLAVRVERNDSMHLCVFVEGDSLPQYLVCNPYHLHVGIDHKYLLETEKEKGTIVLSGLEKKLFLDKETGFPCYYYLYNEYYEPFITDQKVRDRILIEIIYDLYEDGVLTPENEDKVIKLTFNGDKEFVNTWKKAKRCKFLSFEKPEEPIEAGKHFFVVNFNHIEKSKTIISTTFSLNFSSLQNIIV